MYQRIKLTVQTNLWPIYWHIL